MGYGEARSREREGRKVTTVLVALLLVLSFFLTMLPTSVAAPNPIPYVEVYLDQDHQTAKPSPLKPDQLTYTGNVTVIKGENSLTATTTLRAWVEDEDWDTIVSPEQFQGNAQGHVYRFYVSVSVPSDALCKDDYVLRVQATTTVTRFIATTASDSATISVLGFCSASMRSSPRTLEIDPGSVGEATGTVTNDGNMNATFSLSVDKAPSGFIVFFGTTDFFLPAGESIEIKVTISVAEYVTPGDHRIFLLLEKTSPPAGGYLRLTHEMMVDTNPVEAVLTATPLKVAPGMDVTFDGSKSVLGSGPGKYLFDYGDTETSGWQTLSEVKHSYDRVGEYTARLTVQDAGGVRSTNDAFATIAVTTEGFKPTAEILDVSPDPAHHGELVTMTGKGTPVQGTAIKAFEWRSSRDGSLGSLALVTTDQLTQGSHMITLRVQDQRDTWSDPACVNLTVLPPRSAWSLEVTTPRGGAHLSGPTATVKGTAFFATVSIDRVELRVDGGTWMTVQGRTDWQFTLDLTELREGKHTLEVRAHGGGSVSDVVAVTFHKGGEETSGTFVGDITYGQLGVAVLLAVVVAALAVANRRRVRAHSL
jgi:PKD repeat protein